MNSYPSGGIDCSSGHNGGRFDTTAPFVSLIIPMYNEAEVLQALFASIQQVMDNLALEYEAICIDDGSTDGTYEALASMDKPHIKAFRFSKNFGKEVALSAGLDLACGDIVIPMDADLQEPPELIATMLEKWKEGYDVVFAIRCCRKSDGMAKSTFAKFFYKLFNKVSDCKIPENAGDFRLMDRRVVDVLKVLPERNRFMKGLLTWPGFRSTHIFFERPARCAGTTKWKPHKLVGLAINGLTSFSIVPLRVASLLGAVISLAAFFFGIVVIIKRLLVGDAVQGYASLMSVIVFLGGVQLLALGVMGEYIGRIYIESKQRPLYVITESTTEPDRKHN